MSSCSGALERTFSVDAREIAFPVYGTRGIGDVPSQLCGTAFAIGGGVFATAAHVLRCASQHPQSAVGFVPAGTGGRPTRTTEALIDDVEHLSDFDVALFYCKGGPYRALPWERTSVPLLTEFTCFGYPYGLDSALKRITVRGYRGVISAQHPLEQLPASPEGYELSVPAARGLSGAPVLTTAGLRVVGIISMNAQSQMLVASDTESVSQDGKQTIVERYEFLTYGLAVGSNALVGLNSTLLGSSIGDHLARHGLLA